jgi:ribose/xylose/arabinose/galactoside ABC-type transport system permease subunit
LGFEFSCLAAKVIGGNYLGGRKGSILVAATVAGSLSLRRD